jgi:hypothetical protein
MNGHLAMFGLDGGAGEPFRPLAEAVIGTAEAGVAPVMAHVVAPP